MALKGHQSCFFFVRHFLETQEFFLTAKAEYKDITRKLLVVCSCSGVFLGSVKFKYRGRLIDISSLKPIWETLGFFLVKQTRIKRKTPCVAMTDPRLVMSAWHIISRWRQGSWDGPTLTPPVSDRGCCLPWLWWRHGFSSHTEQWSKLA